MDHTLFVDFALEIIQNPEFTYEQKLRGVERLLLDVKLLAAAEAAFVAEDSETCFDCTINYGKCLKQYPHPTQQQQQACWQTYHDCFLEHCVT